MTTARGHVALPKAAALVEALPWLKSFSGRTVVVKYGGNAMTSPDLQAAFAEDVVFLRYAGVRVVVVHGGEPAQRQAPQRHARCGLGGRRRPGDQVDDIGVGPAGGRGQHQLVHHPVRCGMDLQTEDVDAAVAAAGGQPGQRARPVAHAGAHLPQHGGLRTLREPPACAAHADGHTNRSSSLPMSPAGAAAAVVGASSLTRRDTEGNHA